MTDDKPEPFVLIREAVGVPVEISPSPNRRSPRRMPVELLVLHATAGAFDGALTWLCKGDRPNPTSAHYLVGKTGRTVRLVRHRDGQRDDGGVPRGRTQHHRVGGA